MSVDHEVLGGGYGGEGERERTGREAWAEARTRRGDGEGTVDEWAEAYGKKVEFNGLIWAEVMRDWFGGKENCTNNGRQWVEEAEANVTPHIEDDRLCRIGVGTTDSFLNTQMQYRGVIALAYHVTQRQPAGKKHPRYG